jgi:dTDP-D-glucose 4,6-dehydratase
MGWTKSVNFHDGLSRTIAWYMKNWYKYNYYHSYKTIR